MATKSTHAQIPSHLHGDELKEWLENNATTTREDEYTRLLTEEEITQKNSEYVKNGMLHDVISDEYSATRKNYISKLKVVKAEIKDLSKQIRKKAVDEYGEIYVFRDDDKGRIIEYTSQGQLITDRRMTPEDRQKIIEFPKQNKSA
jgi:hypothetical protein